MSDVEMQVADMVGPEAGSAGFVIEEPIARPYAGTLLLQVDATDVDRGIFNVRQRIPVARAGTMVLLYPKWLPGFHAPVAPIELFAGLRIRANTAELAWQRHPVEVHAFLVDVPAGVDAIDVEFAFLSPTDPSQGRVICSPDLFCLPWNSVVLYPAGYAARWIEVETQLTLPTGWSYASPLAPIQRNGDVIAFAPVALDVLVDSPVLAARFLRQFDLGEEVTLHVAADAPHLLDTTPEQIASHHAVVAETVSLFGARSYDRFDMLLALSGTLSAAGIEHHRCFEGISDPRYFAAWNENLVRRDTIPHEFVHSWNGKHRRGADSCSASFDKPIRNDLLWVYEGQTQYWTHVLCARSGLWSLEVARGALALTAARYDVRPGSEWRPLLDTTRDPIIAARSPLPWPSWQRSEDYYAEGALLWLDVDTRLRELSGDSHCLDDFARTFFGGRDGDWSTRPYLFQDVIDTLDDIVSFEWGEWFDRSLGGTRVDAPLEGLERGGYRLVYRDQPSSFQQAQERASKQIDLTHSIGATFDADGRIIDVLWNGPAFHAGLTVGATVVAVAGRDFAAAGLRHAIGERGGGKIVLLVRRADALHSLTIDVPDTMRYPDLQRIDEVPARLDAIFTPRCR